jgi:hypothetical protein
VDGNYGVRIVEIAASRGGPAIRGRADSDKKGLTA